MEQRREQDEDRETGCNAGKSPQQILVRFTRGDAPGNLKISMNEGFGIVVP